jgi:TolA-binding protein
LPDPAPQIAQLQRRIDELEADLAREQNSKRELEKEQEDLLVLLDELNSKRARDKSRLKDAGIEISEGSDDGGGGDDDDDEEE